MTEKNLEELRSQLKAKLKLRIENCKVDYRRYLRKKNHSKAIITAKKIVELKDRLESI